MKLKNIKGQKFNRLTAIKYLGNSKWLCKCDCGNETIVDGRALRNNTIKSCGCHRKEIAAKNSKENRLKIKEARIKYKKIPYDEKYQRLYRIWNGMKFRCYNNKSNNYKNYGYRGIKICEEWHNFENFYKWAIKNNYSKELTIDRINVNDDYEPKNCRWVDKTIQARNTRKNHFLVYKNEKLCLSEWSEKTGLHPSTIAYRTKIGLPLEQILDKKKKVNQYG